MADSYHHVSHPLLEVCVDTAAGVRAAADNGADRIELCAALAVGGLTPSAGLMKLAAATGVATRAMIRPREGDFTYSANELAVMRGDIAMAAACGLEGVALCANLPSGALDVAALESLAGQARGLGLKVAIHRGFDLAPEPLAALETAVTLGVATILTSGGALTAPEGVAGLAALVAAAKGRIEILGGGGVNADNAPHLSRAGVTAFHASCSHALPIREGRAAALGYVTAAQRDTDPLRVAALRRLLNTLPAEARHVLR